ncbi:3-oxoacyl-[acyl-carrier protein] reductase [Paraburkholderia sp. RAU2J]|uniref:SDR family NAD(P)-dependent oxidoreductase n=1 Tax=Paraburkholderia sp. RAU2J TaxID=1938810 RepID=UPI000EB150DF|nr:SDR family NAD(P)-dependent oxidoreductase [Paraburkholderia sp. RAU2J]RKT22199.1 3-oxoacyl-[acyl-carrier protein] reductase [Paraburkholderia sp. RAU2J]
MQIALDGKVALVTGAATGIGRATARMLASAGARVAVGHFNQHEAASEVCRDIEAAGGIAQAYDFDVTDSAAFQAAVAELGERWRRIDVLVNNAGVLLDKPFLETSEADWRRVVDIDLTGVFIGCRAVLPSMLHARQGVIVNIASELGMLGRAHFAPYCAAKAGVIALTRSLAREFAPTVRINAVAPGPVATAMLSADHMSAEALALEAAIPAGRVGSPNEIAATIVFLASDHASFYHGQTISPNGGAWMG